LLRIVLVVAVPPHSCRSLPLLIVPLLPPLPLSLPPSPSTFGPRSPPEWIGPCLQRHIVQPIVLPSPAVQGGGRSDNRWHLFGAQSLSGVRGGRPVLLRRCRDHQRHPCIAAEWHWRPTGPRCWQRGQGWRSLWQGRGAGASQRGTMLDTP
jgi:hypothetical protein